MRAWRAVMARLVAGAGAGAVVVLAVGGLAVGAGTASAAGLPSCLDHTWKGPSGFIAARTSPSGTVAWTVRDWTDNGGIWNVRVLVNKRQFDAKLGYTYNPHGSIPPSHAPTGSIVSFVIDHVDSAGRKSVSVPNGCVVP